MQLQLPIREASGLLLVLRDLWFWRYWLYPVYPLSWFTCMKPSILSPGIQNLQSKSQEIEPYLRGRCIYLVGQHSAYALLISGKMSMRSSSIVLFGLQEWWALGRRPWERSFHKFSVIHFSTGLCNNALLLYQKNLHCQNIKKDLRAHTNVHITSMIYISPATIYVNNHIAELIHQDDLIDIVVQRLIGGARCWGNLRGRYF